MKEIDNNRLHAFAKTSNLPDTMHTFIDLSLVSENNENENLWTDDFLYKFQSLQNC